MLVAGLFLQWFDVKPFSYFPQKEGSRKHSDEGLCAARLHSYKARFHSTTRRNNWESSGK